MNTDALKLLSIMMGIALICGLASEAQSQTSLIVPLATKHVNVPYYYPELQEQNRGIGIEYQSGKYLYSLMYLKNNSFNKPSFYATISRTLQLDKNWTLAAGITVATGYHIVFEDSSKNVDRPVVAGPTLSIKYKSIRLVTSYPFGSLSHVDHADFFNLQYVQEF